MIPTRDPSTGDELTRSEAISWLAQSIIRRWTFIAAFTVITFAVWIFGSPVVLGWWNYTASWLALVIESVVGIGVFQASRRDAVILRRDAAILREVHQMGTEIAKLAEKQDKLAEEIYDHMLRQER